MTRYDHEIEELRDKVHCAVVLEQTPPCWKLDRKESTKLSLKYRRGKGEILIISHAGRGWWDPTSDAKGDVFRLVQRLEPGLSFGHVRKRLRAFAGLSPGFPSGDRMLLPLVIRRRPEPSEVILAGERNRHTARQTRLSPGVGSLAAASRPPPLYSRLGSGDTSDST